MKQQIKNGIIFGLTGGIVFILFGVVYAAWNDTVSNGDTVSASSWNALVGKISDIESDMSSMSGSISTFSPPPTCNGASNALRWTGSSWTCATLIRECRVCIQLTSNSTIDGAKKCSSYSHSGSHNATGSSGWAEAGAGTYGGGKYAAHAWIECR